MVNLQTFQSHYRKEYVSRQYLLQEHRKVERHNSHNSLHQQTNVHKHRHHEVAENHERQDGDHLETHRHMQK